MPDHPTMKLTQEIIKSIEASVLCWLATVSAKGVPNVSPKEIFIHFGDNQIIIANIASPRSVRNIRSNSQVCVSFIDILVQKGFQIKGTAEIVKNDDSRFVTMERPLLEMTGGKFPFSEIILIHVETTKPIIAPKYILYPDTTESEQIESAKKTYGF